MKNRRVINLLLAFLLVLTGIPNSIRASEENTAYLDTYMQELASLVQETWSDSFLSEIELRIDDTIMTVNGVDMEIDPLSDAAPFLSESGVFHPHK